MEDVIKGSKIIAEYMNLVYLPFSVELKEKGMKPGWHETKQRNTERYPTIEIDGEIKEVKIDFEKIINTKNGWKLFEEEGKSPKYYKFVCRHHSGLRYYNSWDSLIPVIEKIEKESGLHFVIQKGGCELNRAEYGTYYESYEENLTWIQNTFNIIVRYLENEKNKNNI